MGQIYGVATHTARVMPITEPSSAVAVRLQRSRDTGILEGLGDWRCEVRYLCGGSCRAWGGESVQRDPDAPPTDCCPLEDRARGLLQAARSYLEGVVW